MNPLGYQPESKENLLADSGFKTLSLNTPAKVAAFKKLPPHRISQTTFKGKPVWVYPDQNVCGCLYVGGQTAYNTFIKKGRAQMIDSRVNQMYNQDAGDPYNPTATWRSSTGATPGTTPTPTASTSTAVHAGPRASSRSDSRAGWKQEQVLEAARQPPSNAGAAFTSLRSTFFTISVSLAWVGAGTPM